MRTIATAIALIVFIVNPGFGCGEDFDFGPDEMRRAAEGTWELSFEGDAAPRAVVSLSHSAPQAGGSGWSAVRGAHACGTRTFMAQAGACSTSTVLTFHARTISSQAPFASVTEASFEVGSYSFSRGRLGLRFSNAASVELGLDPIGTVLHAHFVPISAAPAASKLVAVRRR